MSIRILRLNFPVHKGERNSRVDASVVKDNNTQKHWGKFSWEILIKYSLRKMNQHTHIS
jgi:hypothetical protein